MKPMYAGRFVLTQSWWLASHLFRRHPGLILIETHPGGGQYDCLSLVRDGHTLIDINRAGSIHVHLDTQYQPQPVTALLGHENPAEIIPTLETAARLIPPAHTPPSTPAVLTYRTIAHLMAITLNDKHRWDVRNERIDSSGMDGGGLLGSLEQFPIAAERAKQHRREDLLGDPYYRYWGVLRDGKAVAVLDIDGFAYVGSHVIHLPAVYQSSNRRLTPTVAAALGSILP